MGMTLLFLIGTQLVFKSDSQDEAPSINDHQQVDPGGVKGPPVDVRINRGNLLHFAQREDGLGRDTQRLNRTKLQGPPPPPVFMGFDSRLSRVNLPGGRPKDSNEQFPHFNVDYEVLEKIPKFFNRYQNINEDQSPPEVAQKDPWEIWKGWVKPDYLYPEGAFWSDEMNYILNAMATAPITSFGVGHKGTQLKASLFLGKQRTAFKPMRYV